jgi:phage FluMu protein Com
MHTTLTQVRLDQYENNDLRCDCGKLLARVVHAVIELKCSRCKRVVLVVGGRRFEEQGRQGSCTCAGDSELRVAP